ncbi:MAG: tetratricopeptide repeat protein [Acidobacteriaceae bacterium]
MNLPAVAPAKAQQSHSCQTQQRSQALLLVIACLLLLSPLVSQAQDPALLAKANAGDAAAETQLGDYYAGLNSDDGYTKAAAWYLKASNQGDPKAQFALGSLYCWHQGVPLDFSTAYFWLDLAVTAGHPDDNHMRSYAWSHLTADQVTAAQQKVKAWQHTHKEKSAS